MWTFTNIQMQHKFTILEMMFSQTNTVSSQYLWSTAEIVQKVDWNIFLQSLKKRWMKCLIKMMLFFHLQ